MSVQVEIADNHCVWVVICVEVHCGRKPAPQTVLNSH